MQYYIVQGEEDFEAVSTILTFSREESVQCIAVSVINDAVLEETELFLVTLTLRSGSNQIKFDNSVTTVEIVSKHFVVVTLIKCGLQLLCNLCYITISLPLYYTPMFVNIHIQMCSHKM